VLPWLLLSLGVILAVVAIGLDGGRMMDERRHAQAAADAAALAAAADLYDNFLFGLGLDPFGTAAAAARRSAAANGFADDGTNSTVTVNVPPTSGPFAGKPSHVEVVIRSHPPATFSAAFNPGGLTVSARAVARGRPKKIGVLLLRPTGADAFYDDSTATVRIADAALAVNSADNVAYRVGIGAHVEALEHDVVGDYQAPGGAILGRIFTGERALPDPLGGLTPPDPAAYPVRSNATLNVTALPTVLLPGVYRGGISVSKLGSVVMLPGVYVMDGGGLSVTDLGAVAGVEVMVYNTGSPAGPISLGGLGTVVLTAPTGGPYQGISLFQDRSSNQLVRVAGNANFVLTGTVYAPGAPVEVSAQGTSLTNILGGAYVCSSLKVTGDGNFSIDLGFNRPKVPEVDLVD
jgi:hypothetical protein